MDVIDTTPYVPVQRAYFRKIECQNILSEREKKLAKCTAKLDKARNASTQASAALEAAGQTLERGSDDPREYRELQKAFESAQRKLARASEKVITL